MNLVKYKKAHFEKNKLTLDYNISLDEWKELGQALKQVEGSVQFWIGDWARFGEKKGYYTNPKVYDELEEITGLDRQTIKDYKYVAENTSSLRHDDLDFSHHREVAKLEPHKQKQFLKQASENSLSVRQLREEIKKEEREDKQNVVKKLAKNYSNESIKIYNADFREYSNNIKENSIDAIITDPPYPSEHLELWQDLFTVANRILKPSSFLIAYSGQMYLDKIFRMKNDLIYYWTMNIVFSKKPLIFGRNIINEWKPILLFQKPPFKLISDTISDTISFDYSERDMHNDNWGQTIKPFEFLIDKFTKPNDIIFEPFAGTGTTLIACKNMARQCIATELDKTYIDLIKGRLVERHVA